MIQEAIDNDNYKALYDFNNKLKVLGMSSNEYRIMKIGRYAIDTYLSYKKVAVMFDGENIYIYNRYSQSTSFNIDNLNSSFYDTAIEFIRDEIHRSFSMPDTQAQPLARLKRFFGVE